MYLQHFGLTEFPFGITPDTSFTFSAHGHQEALNTLLVALQCGEGFVKITGEVGTGKTLLCRRLLQTLGEGVVTAYLPNPNLEPQTLLQALAEELRIADAGGLDQYHLLRRINHALLDYARAGKRVVLCIDEAQAMPLDTLEALRLVSNLETEKRKLIQIALFGQPELDEKLSDPSVRQLLQRMLQASEGSLPGLIQENDAQIDAQLFQILSASASRTAQSGNSAAVQVFAGLQQALLEHSTFGKQVLERQKVADAAADELRKLGDKLGPDTFMELVLKATSDDQLAVYISMARPLADYAFFESLTRRIDRSEEPEKSALAHKREVLLALTQEIDAEARARLDVAAGPVQRLSMLGASVNARAILPRSRSSGSPGGAIWSSAVGPVQSLAVHPERPRSKRISPMRTDQKLGRPVPSR